MKLLTLVLAGLSLIGTCGVLWQRHGLSELRAGFQRTETAVDYNQLAALETEASALKNATKDLAKLRSEVGQLRAKQNEITLARVENERLAETKRTGAPLPREVPPGFIGKEQLRNAGYETPEDAMQTFFWAIREGSFEMVMQTFSLENRARAYYENLSPENRAKEIETFKRQTSEPMIKYFNDFAVVRRENLSDDTVLLHVGSSISTNTLTHRFTRVGQEWKLDDL